MKDYTSVLNVRISSLTYEKTLRNINSWILENKKSYICVAPVHLVIECQRDDKLLKGVNSAGLVTPDGMPLVWLSKLYGKKNVERVYGPTLMVKVARLAQEKKYKVFLLGGKSGVSSEASRMLLKTFPKLKIVGHQDTPIRPIPEREKDRVIKKINRSGAHIVFVGIGCPHQELWMIENRKYLNANLLIGVGGAFDIFSGRVRQAPYWMQDIGLEWIFRFLQEPRRLWRRYTLINAEFIYKISLQIGKDFIFHREL